MTTSTATQSSPPTLRRVSRSGSKRAAVRWGFRLLFLIMVALNGLWIWGDRVPAEMKVIDSTIAKGRLIEAERALRQRLIWSPNDGDARVRLARILLRRGDNLAGAQQLHLVPYWWPTKGEAVFLEGQAFKLVNRSVEAEAAWKTCIADDPLHPLAPQMFHGSARELVAFYVLEGKLDEARQTLWRAYEEATPIERPGVLQTRIRLELERIDHQEAVDKLRAFVEANPEDWDARRALALEEHAISDPSSADRDIDACLRARPDDPLAWRAKLEILNARGETEAAQAVIDRLPPSAKGDAKIWMYKGISRQVAGDRQGALDAFNQAFRLAPNDPEIIYKLGMAEQFMGQGTLARDHIARSRQLHSAYARLHHAYQGFAEQVVRNPHDEAGYRAAVELLADLCQQLGWPREAEAWRKQITPG